MTIFYSVTQRIYDNGKVVTTRDTIEAEVKPADVCREGAQYDYYKTYFDTEKERDQFYKENKG